MGIQGVASQLPAKIRVRRATIDLRKPRLEIGQELTRGLAGPLGEDLVPLRAGKPGDGPSHHGTFGRHGSYRGHRGAEGGYGAALVNRGRRGVED
jgi:hypothetical protein